MLAALRFDDPRLEVLRELDDSGWKEMLRLADRERMTLALALRCCDAMPGWVAERVSSDLKKNAARLARIHGLYEEIAAALHSAGIEFALLKGFTHTGGYVDDAA